MTLSVSGFSSGASLKTARPQYSAQLNHASKTIQFGADQAESADPKASSQDTVGFLKSVGKHMLESPLPLWRRPLAFLNPKNWIAGFKEAKQTFGESKNKTLEGLGLAIDIGLSCISLKVLFVLNALFPNFLITNTGKAFFRGIHQASADKLAAKQAETAQ
jgi:hypothetical protein